MFQETVPINLHRTAPAIPATEMLQGLIVPGLKSFRELVSDLDEQLSMAMGKESESNACAWLMDEANKQVIAMSRRLHAKILFLAFPLVFSA